MLHGEDTGITNDGNDTLIKSATRIKTICTGAASDFGICSSGMLKHS